LLEQLLVSLSADASEARIKIKYSPFSEAQYTGTNDDIGTSYTTTESCAVCHGPDRVADVKEVHGID